MTDIDPYFTPSLPATALYATAHGIRLALGSALHERQLLDVRGDMAIECMDQMLLMLDNTKDHDRAMTRFALRRLVLKLAKASQLFPSGLYFHSIRALEPHPKYGGAYADVYLAEEYSGTPVAIKRLRTFQATTSTARSRNQQVFLREAIVWRQLRHPAILPFLGINDHILDPHVCMVSPWMERGNILQHVCSERERGRTDLPLARWICQITDGMRYLHKECIVHGDLRAANILIDNEGKGNVRIGDFGLIKVVDINSASFGSCHLGNARWLPPEALEETATKPTYEGDVYAFGCTWIEIYTLSVPMSELTDAQVIVKKLRGRGPQWPIPNEYPVEELCLEDWAFVRGCWEVQPTSRPTMGYLYQQAHSACMSTSENTLNTTFGDLSLDEIRRALRVLGDNVDPFMRTPLPPTCEEDVVDLADAFGMSNRGSSNNTSASATLHENETHSDVSLEMLERSRAEDPNALLTSTWQSQDPADPSTYAYAGLYSTPGAEDDVITLTSGSTLLGGFGEGPSVKAHPRAAHKLMKLLGSDAPQHYLEKLTAGVKPQWYLRPNYDRSEILINPDGGVRAGTTTALVERLTAHEWGDPKFVRNFLLTFKSFMTLQEFFDLLVERFWMQPPPNLGFGELEEWKKLKQYVVRMRVLNTFKKLVIDEDMLDENDLWILDKMKKFASNPEALSYPAAKQLIVIIDRRQHGGCPIKATQMILPSQAPTPILPKSSKKLKLLDIDPIELARQLTLMETTLYDKVRLIEYIQPSRESKHRTLQDNITPILRLGSKITNWVAGSILERADARKRATAVKYFIKLAHECRLLRNYSTMTSITSGLRNSSIQRLRSTWGRVGSKPMRILSDCNSAINTNDDSVEHLQILACFSPTIVPSIGHLLKTLRFIHNNAAHKLSGQLIDFQQYQKAAEVLQVIKCCRLVPYKLTSVSPIVSFLDEALNKYADDINYEKEILDLSCKQEP